MWLICSCVPCSFLPPCSFLRPSFRADQNQNPKRKRRAKALKHTNSRPFYVFNVQNLLGESNPNKTHLGKRWKYINIIISIYKSKKRGLQLKTPLFFAMLHAIKNNRHNPYTSYNMFLNSLHFLDCFWLVQSC